MKQKVKSKITDKILAALIILSGVLALSFTFKTTVTNDIAEKSILTEKVENIKPETIEEIVFPSQDLKTLNILNEIQKDTIKKRKHYHNEIDIDNNIVTKTYRDDNSMTKEMQFTLNKGNVTRLLIDGQEIPEKDYYKYQKEIDKTIDDLKDAKGDIRDAMQDIEDIDFEEIQKEVQEAMSNIDIDYKEIQKEIEIAMQEVKEIDYEKIIKEVEMNLDVLKDLDFDMDFEDIHIDVDKIKEEIKKAQLEMEQQIDMKALQEDMIKMQEELSKIQIEEIKMQVEKEHKKFEEFDKEKVMKELEEKLEELEKLELEEK